MFTIRVEAEKFGMDSRALLRLLHAARIQTVRSGNPCIDLPRTVGAKPSAVKWRMHSAANA